MIQENLFDLTDEQKGMSEMIYNGKIIKCLVAPYHSHRELEEKLTYTPTTYLFPEKEMNLMQVRSFISALVANANITDEIRIITTSQNIIMDMVDGCVRVLTEGGDVVPSPCKTFMANIHTIRHELLENEAHQLSENQRHQANYVVTGLIDRVNNHKDNNIPMEKGAYDTMMSQIENIGEPIIREKLKEMAWGIQVTKPKPKKSLATLTKELSAAIKAEDYEKAAEIKKDIDLLKEG